MTNVQCSKCGEWCDIDDTDFWQGDLEDIADDNLIFRFTDYCEGVIEDGDDWETCGHTIEVLATQPYLNTEILNRRNETWDGII